MKLTIEEYLAAVQIYASLCTAQADTAVIDAAHKKIQDHYQTLSDELDMWKTRAYGLDKVLQAHGMGHFSLLIEQKHLRMGKRNSLTEAQIKCRPKPFTGMLYFNLAKSVWSEIARWENPGNIPQDKILLPGEPGCPLVTDELKHDWNEQQKAWLLDNNLQFSGYDWVQVTVIDFSSVSERPEANNLEFTADDGVGVITWPINTPAIYIPNDK